MPCKVWCLWKATVEMSETMALRGRGMRPRLGNSQLCFAPVSVLLTYLPITDRPQVDANEGQAAEIDRPRAWRS